MQATLPFLKISDTPSAPSWNGTLVQDKASDLLLLHQRTDRGLYFNLRPAGRSACSFTFSLSGSSALSAESGRTAAKNPSLRKFIFRIVLIADLIGTVEGGPTDMSARKKEYMKTKDYGKSHHR